MTEFIPLPARGRRAVLLADGGFRLEEVPVPALDPGDLLVRLLFAGLGAGDLDPARHGGRTPPAVTVGEVAAIGPGSTGWGPLDRVLLHHPAGGDRPSFSGLAEFVRVPAAAVTGRAAVRLPQEIPSEDATLVPAAATAARLLHAARVPAGGNLAVLGLGLVGQIVILLARHQRVDRIFAADASSTLRKKAEWSGATRVVRLPEEPLGQTVQGAAEARAVQAAVVLIPDAGLVHEALGFLAPEGILVLGASFPRSVMMALSPARFGEEQLTLTGVRSFEPRDLREALQAVRLGIVNGESLVSRRIAFEDLEGTGIDPGYFAHGTHVVVEGPTGP